MSKFFLRSERTSGPEDWRYGLAKPDKHWKTGYSAKALAYCWEEAKGFPPEVTETFEESGRALFNGLEFVRGDVEFVTPLPGGNAGSHSDILVLAKNGLHRVILAVEGKHNESFEEPVRKWLKNKSSRSGKPTRLEFLTNKLGLDKSSVHDIRYQLLHRTASALIEAERYGAGSAMMLVHSFSQTDKRLEDYQAFVDLFGAKGDVNKVTLAGNKQGIDLYLAWVRGDKRFLEF